MIAKPAGVFDERAGQFDHLSMDLPDEEALLALRQRLLDAGSEVTDVVDHGLMRSIYFTDPNGIALEASWWSEDPTLTHPTTPTTRTSRTPTRCRRSHELRAGGLRAIPRTTLVDEPDRRLLRRLGPVMSAGRRWRQFSAGPPDLEPRLGAARHRLDQNAVR